MLGFELSTVVHRPVEEVFAFLAELANDPKWRKEWVDAKKTTDGELGVGSRCVLMGQFLFFHPEAEYEIFEYEPGRRVAWKTVRGPLPLTFFRRVEPVDGATKLTIGYEAEPRGLLKLLSPLVARAGKRALAGDYPKLKELMEA